MKKDSFRYGKPVRDPKDFFGREEKVKNIYNQILASNSISLIGEKKTGKTSLLLHLANPQTLAENGISSENVLIFFIDISLCSFSKSSDVFRKFLECISEKITGEIKKKSKNLLKRDYIHFSQFEDIVSKLKYKNQKIVFLLDEFESISMLKQGNIYSRMRSLAQMYDVVFVISTLCDPKSSFRDERFSKSPFFNILTKYRLRGLDEESARDLLKTHFERENIKVDLPIINSIIKFSGMNPFFLKIACFFCIKMKIEFQNAFDDNLKILLQKEFEPYHKENWDRLPRNEQIALLDIVQNNNINENFVENNLERKGYIARGNDGLYIVSESFYEYIKNNKFKERARCTYTWKKKHCPEEIWSGSKKYCIFHDPSSDKNIELFKQKLNKKLNRGDYNFQGYYFPINWDFSGKKFEKDVYFDKVTFQKNMDFEKTIFKHYASFYETNFQDVVFNEAVFKKVSFDKTKFVKSSFNRTKFKDASFNEAIFQDNTDFMKADFHVVSFDNASFQDVFFDQANFMNASFDQAVFEKNAYFRETTFQSDAFFNEVIFNNVVFDKASFQNVSFKGAFIERYLKLNTGQIEKLDLSDAHFLFKGSITANLTQTKFHQADLDNVIFIDCDWQKGKKIHEEKHREEENLLFKDLEIIYRNLKQNMQHSGNYSEASGFFYREMEMKRKRAEKWIDRLWLWIYRLLAGYGERPYYTIVASVIIIFTFAGLFLRGECLQYTMASPCLFQKFIDALYFSFVTFTTLGLGDIQPVTVWGKVLICLEALIGAFLIALFVVVFVRKMAR